MEGYIVLRQHHRDLPHAPLLRAGRRRSVPAQRAGAADRATAAAWSTRRSGPTHLAIEDIAIMRALPNMTIVAAADADEMKRFMDADDRTGRGPIYIRLGKGGDPDRHPGPRTASPSARPSHARAPAERCMATTGVMLNRRAGAPPSCSPSGHRRRRRALSHRQAAGHERRCSTSRRGVDAVVTVEEHTVIGGLGSAVLEGLSDNGVFDKPVLRLGLPDRFTHNYGSQDGLDQALRPRRGRHCRRGREIHGPPGDRATGLTDERMRGPCSRFATPTCRSSSPTRATILEELRRFVPTGDFTLGKPRSRVRAALCRVIGTRHAIGVGSGTDAIKLPLEGARHRPWRRGDHRRQHASLPPSAPSPRSAPQPVFVDCDDTFCMDVEPGRGRDHAAHQGDHAGALHRLHDRHARA